MTVLETSPRPSRSTGRIHALDLARGIAIFGTLGTNIWIFSHVGGFPGYTHELFSGEVVSFAQRLLMALSNGKFLGLLTLMFGIGLEIQRRSTLRAGRRWPGGYLWRAALLLVDGVVHYLLLTEFDVLMGYAVTGGVVAFLLATSERGQRIWMWLTAGFHVLAITLVTLAVSLGEMRLTGSQGGIPGPNPYADGSFWDLVVLRIDNVATFRFEPVMIFGMSIAMFLIGSRLFRAGIFDERGATLRRRCMIIGLGIALPLDLAMGTFYTGTSFFMERYVFAPVVAVGLLALIAHIGLHTSPRAWVSSRLQEVGRMALTGYVLQNLLASIIFYGWGLGLAARWSDWRTPTTIISLVIICAAVTLFANLWFRRFRQGPVEWLWKESYQRLSRVGRNRDLDQRPRAAVSR